MQKKRIISNESELLLNCLDFDILIINDKFEIIFANQYFLDRMHLDKNKVVGDYCYKITHRLDSQCKPPHDPCPVDLVAKTKKPSVELHHHYTKDNKMFEANVVAVPILLDEKINTYLHVSLPVLKGFDKQEDVKQAIIKTLDILMVIQTYQDKIQELEKTKKKLETKMEELEKFNKMAVGRELKMAALKKQLDKLKDQI